MNELSQITTLEERVRRLESRKVALQLGLVALGAARFSHGGSGFALHGEDSRGAAVLYHKGDQGRLSFYDTDGTLRTQVPQPPAWP